MEEACPLLFEDTSLSLIEKPIITSPGEDDLKRDDHSLQDPPHLQLPLVVTRPITRVDSQHAPGSRAHALTQKEMAHAPRDLQDFAKYIGINLANTCGNRF